MSASFVSLVTLRFLHNPIIRVTSVVLQLGLKQDLSIYYRNTVCYKLETVCICHSFAGYFFYIHSFCQERTKKMKETFNNEVSVG